LIGVVSLQLMTGVPMTQTKVVLSPTLEHVGFNSVIEKERREAWQILGMSFFGTFNSEPSIYVGPHEITPELLARTRLEFAELNAGVVEQMLLSGLSENDAAITQSVLGLLIGMATSEQRVDVRERVKVKILPVVQQLASQSAGELKYAADLVIHLWSPTASSAPI
jgi:hypothetical protein